MPMETALKPNSGNGRRDGFRGAHASRVRFSGNFLREAVLPRAVPPGTMKTLPEKLIKIGAKVVRHSRRISFQMAKVAMPREMFQTILERIGRLRLAVMATE